MGSINIQNVMVQFGGRVVLDQVTIELNSGEIVGLVGPNGAGKTTLFRLILGRLAPDGGTVTCSRGMEIGYLPQDPVVDLAATLHDEVLSAFADLVALEQKMHRLSDEIAAAHGGPGYEALLDQYHKAESQFVAEDGYSIESRLKEIVGGLGFREEDYKLPMSALSGGQKCRVALAKLLLRDNNYLLLDEPTNHLDIDAVRWLEKFLTGHHGGAAIISHDRYLLDRLADRIIEVDRSKASSYPGNYSNFVKVRELRRLTQERQYEKDKEFIEKERDYIARNIASKRTDVAKGRRTRLERRLEAGEFVTERPGTRRTVKLEFQGEVEAGRTIFDVAGVTKRYGSRELFEKLSFAVGSGERLGITGPNGTGKSTLLKVMLAQVEPDEGRVERDPRSVFGYYAQEGRDLNPEGTVLSEIQAVRPHFTEQQARTYLGRFLFSGDDVFKPVVRLSGGEQSRVRLVKLILQSPNVLVLDEPTNHLDIPSREALEEALDDYRGTIVAVSHDRYFLDRIATRLLVLRAGTHIKFFGNYSQWIEAEEGGASTRESEAREGIPASGSARKDSRTSEKKDARTSGNKEARSSEKTGRKNPQKMSRFERMAIEELEAFIMEQERRIAELNERFGDPALARDREALARIQQEFDAARAELAEAEEAWIRRG